MEKKKCQIRNTFRDFPDGPDSAVPLQGLGVASRMPHSAAGRKKKKKNNQAL